MTIENPKHLTTRDMYDSEQDAIRAVTLAAYEEYAAVMPPPIWAGYRQMILTTLDEKGAVERIIAELDGAIVGSVLLYPPNGNTYPGMVDSIDWPEVRLLAVMPAMRGRGIGVALMEECKRRARHSGATVLGLHTTDMMQTAMRMYERMGFVRAPAYDLRPGRNMLVKAYHLSLADADGTNED
jgi:GNAT superfamily N-acetyltransferase